MMDTRMHSMKIHGDGLIDIDEGFGYATKMDTDDDGLLDGEEVDLGTTINRGFRRGWSRRWYRDGNSTDPLLSDTDGDGFSDAEEVLAGSFQKMRSVQGKQLMLERDRMNLME